MEPKWSQNGAQMELKWRQSAPVDLPGVPVREHVLFQCLKFPKWSQKGAKREHKSEKNVSKKRSQKQQRFQTHFLISFHDFGAICRYFFITFLCFVSQLRKTADMRFDCAMASGLRVGPTKMKPKSFQNPSKIDLEKKNFPKCKKFEF